jgi:hypothetical protein
LNKDLSFSKCYIKSHIGREYDVIKELEKRGGKNVYHFKGGGGPNFIYYINHKGEIAWTTEETEIGYILLNSGWTEIKLKQPKKTRRFVITVTEGRARCGSCPMAKECDETQKTKCVLAKELSELFNVDRNLDGRTAKIKEVEYPPDNYPFVLD